MIAIFVQRPAPDTPKPLCNFGGSAACLGIVVALHKDLQELSLAPFRIGCITELSFY